MKFINIKKVCSIPILFVGVTLGIILVFDCFSPDFNIVVPMNYVGGDDVGLLMDIKAVLQTGWGWSFSRLGAPFANVSALDYPSSLMRNFDYFVILLLSFFTKDIGVIHNLFVFLSFYLSAFVMWLVLKNIKVSAGLSILGAWAFSFSPYAIQRSGGHTMLIFTAFIPLAILMCWWLFSDEKFMRKGEFFKYPRNRWAVLFCLLLSSTGIVYYTYFSCFLFCVTTICLLFDDNKRKNWARGIKLISIMIFWILISVIPYLCHIISAGFIDMPVRQSAEAEVYGLKLIQMLIPLDGNGVSLLEKIVIRYNTTAPLVTENSTAYLGIFAIMGLFIGLFNIFNTKAEKESRLLFLFSRLMIACILLGTVGGIGAVIGYFITPMIRGYNRISIFILCICLCIICVCIEWWLGSIKKTMHKCILTIVVFTVFGIGIIEQMTFRTAVSGDAYFSDKNFIQMIEKQMPDNSIIYQLPFHIYPEGGPVRNMPDYAQMVGYIHSDSLKWSYGSYFGRTESEVIGQIANGDINSILKKMNVVGYNGILIDSRAYSEEELAELVHEIEEQTQTEYIASRNGNLLFFDLQTYFAEQGNVSQTRYDVGSDLFIGGGFSHIENGMFAWTNKEEAVIYCDLKQRDYTMVIHQGNKIPLKELNKQAQKLDVFINNKKCETVLINQENNGQDIILDVPKKSLRD